MKWGGMIIVLCGAVTMIDENNLGKKNNVLKCSTVSSHGVGFKTFLSLFSLVKMDHVDCVRFYRSQNVKHIQIWRKRIGRMDKRFKEMKGSPCVCSNHFKFGRPTKDSPHPVLYLKGYPGISSISPVEKQRKRRTIERKVVSNQFKKVAKRKTNIVRDQLIEANDDGVNNNAVGGYLDRGNDGGKIFTPIPFLDHDYCFSELAESQREDDCCEKCKDLVCELKAKIKELENRNALLEDKINKPFEITEIKQNNELVERYTGLQNYGVFQWIHLKLKDKAQKLQYYKGKRSYSVKPYQVNPKREKPGKKRQMTTEQEFFMTLCRLRQNLSLDDLAYRFKTSQSNISAILSTWIPFLARELAGLIQWPSQDHLVRFQPDAFKQFPRVCSIIDCTEIFIQKPSLAEAQALTYSTYKSHNTSKYLVIAVRNLLLYK